MIENKQYERIVLVNEIENMGTLYFENRNEV
jgi:hypothetical protein